MTRRPRIRYGILDDFGDVIRWTFTKPAGRQFITQKRPSDYEVARKLGNAPW